jgi:hypothetical protein
MSKRIHYLCPINPDVVLCSEDADEDDQKLIKTVDVGRLCSACNKRYYIWECVRKEVDE